jgi:hypothetical protein
MFCLIVMLLRKNQGRRKGWRRRKSRRRTCRKSRKMLHPSRQRNKSRLWRPKRWLSRRISPCPRWCGSGYPRLQRLQRALIRSNQVKSLAMDYKRSDRREATRFVKSRISYWEDNPIPEFLSFLIIQFWILLRKDNIRDIILGWIFFLIMNPLHEPSYVFVCFFSRNHNQINSETNSTTHPLYDVVVDLFFMLKNTWVEPRLVPRCYLNFSTW